MVIDLNWGEKYFEGVSLKLRAEKEISKMLSLPKEQVILNYGANSNIILLLSALSVNSYKKKKKPLKILIDIPNYFFTLKQIKEWGIELIGVKRNSDFSFPLKKFVEKMKKEKPDIIFLTTPNNPTGISFSDEEMNFIIESSSKNSLVVFDRSCVNIDKEIDSRELLRFKKRIVVIKSFSKSHNMSAERVGYLATNDKKLAEMLHNKKDLDHNNNSIKKLLKLLNNGRLPKKNKKRIRRCLGILKSYCIEKELFITNSKSNFCLIKLPKGVKSSNILKKLEEKNIRIMDGKNLGLGDNYIRIHMTEIKEIILFLKEFDKIL